MAEAHGDKTEKPSAHKLRQARRQGQVARSRELPAALGLLAALLLSWQLLPSWLDDFRRLFALAFVPQADGAVFGATLLLLLKMLAPLALLPLAVVLASLVPGGWVFALQHLAPQWNRLNPLAHLGRLLSAQQASDTAKSLLKALCLLWALYLVASAALGDFFTLQALPLDQALPRAGERLLRALLQLAAVFAAFALLDLPLQHFLFLRRQRMSRQELKEEYKTTEGRPEVKQRIRRLQQHMAQRGVRRAVPTANVVIVNPDHYAVALKYDEDRAEAPFVVAKGVDEMALFIRQLAQEHGVAVLPVPPLARAVYHSTQVNQQIPAALYRAVALVLTYVLQLEAFRAGRRRREPALPADLAVPRELSDPQPRQP